MPTPNTMITHDIVGEHVWPTVNEPSAAVVRPPAARVTALCVAINEPSKHTAHALYIPGTREKLRAKRHER